jgi:hypothetical protein
MKIIMDCPICKKPHEAINLTIKAYPTEPDKPAPDPSIPDEKPRILIYNYVLSCHHVVHVQQEAVTCMAIKTETTGANHNDRQR